MNRKRRGLPKPPGKYDRRCTCPDRENMRFDFECQYHGGKPFNNPLVLYATQPPRRYLRRADLVHLRAPKRKGRPGQRVTTALLRRWVS